MIEKSLQATPEGKKAARDALTDLGITQQQLSTRTKLSLSTISKFFNCKPVDRILFVQICDTLKLDWRSISGLYNSEEIAETLEQENQQTAKIDAIVQSIRGSVRSLIKAQCGKMRVLDMEQPIELTGDQGIYTDVNILEKMTRLRQLGTAELIQQAGLEGFERFGLSGVVARVPGLEAVKQHRKLMVLGKPGAGKTTFLKFLAMSCLEGNVLNDKVPVFMALREFAEAEGKPSLMQFIERERIECDAQILMSQGRGFLLLDGLDEVREEDQKRVIQQIQTFSNQYSRNQFVITCRIAAKEYTFENFREVEVADFSKEQIETFVRKWFGCKDPHGAEVAIGKLLSKLKENDRIQELASSPLLLTLLCLEFEESFDFPESRADLYERGLKVLMSKWDASRKIERNQIYKRLSLKRKEDLLSQLALKTFTEGNYFFKQRTVEAHIADYIANLPDAKDDPDALLLDSEAVLKSIESQHGLLIERARSIYSFSHLTFQEFFAARQIKESRSDELLKQVAKQVAEKRWREVFRLTVEMLPDADQFLRLMKVEVDQILAGDNQLQQFMVWVQEKSELIGASYKPAAIRAIYFALGLAFDLARINEASDVINFDLVDAFGTVNLNLSHVLDHLLSEARAYALFVLADVEFKGDDLLAHADLLGDYLDKASVFALNPELKCKLQELQEQLPDSYCDDVDIDWNGLENFEQWWTANGQSWIEEFRKATIQYCNIGHDWKFSNAQKEKLRQYYDANKLLVDCLNSDCYVSRDVRQEIEETLLLPISEIEKRKTKSCQNN